MESDRLRTGCNQPASATDAPIGGQQSKSNNSNEKKPGEKDYDSMLINLRNEGKKLRSDWDQPGLSQKPSWFDESLFENAKSVYARHFMGINFAHLSGLLLLVRVNSIFRTLNSTGKSDSVAKLFQRYYKTLIFVKRWYEDDIFDENSQAREGLLIVRGMHNKVSSTLNDIKVPTGTPRVVSESEKNSIDDQLSGDEGPLHQRVQQSNSNEASKLISNCDTRNEGVAAGEGFHISEYDIMITQFAFVGFIVTKARNMGLLDDFNHRDLESLLHFWRVIGYYLGSSDKFNLCSYEFNDIVGLCNSISTQEYKKSILDNPISSPSGIMSINIVRSLKFIPMLTIYGMLRYLYELLGIDISETPTKPTAYSRLSYTLIKLVMTNLLAYRALRSFNNGLTRLSVYLVGTIYEWFTHRLESKYGHELKLSS